MLTAIPVFISNLSDLGDDLKLQTGLYPALNWLHSRKLWILPLFAVLAVLVPSIKIATTESRIKTNVKRKLLQTLLSDAFGDEWEKTRVTIFRHASWIRILWVWVKDTFWHPIKFLKRKGMHRFPNPFDKFIIATARAGTENPNPETYFLFVEKTAADCEGIASYAMQINQGNDKREVLIDNLPDINGFDLDNPDNLTNEQKEILQTYMNAGHIKDVGSLCRLHRKARHFFAMFLTDDKLDLKGMLVVDSVAEESPFTDDAKAKVASYSKVFSTTF